MDTNVNVTNVEKETLEVEVPLTRSPYIQINGHNLKKRDNTNDDSRVPSSVKFDCVNCSWKNKPIRVFKIKTCEQKQGEVKELAKTNSL